MRTTSVSLIYCIDLVKGIDDTSDKESEDEAESEMDSEEEAAGIARLEAEIYRLPVWRDPPEP